MDMKKILQALDGAKATTEVNSSDMRKFLQAVTEAELNQPASEETGEPTDPDYAEYADLMARHDLLAKEMEPEAGIEKGASPTFVQELARIKAKAAQIAGPNLQAWEQARQKSNTDLRAQAQANRPALVAQLEEVGMSKLLSIISESRGPLNRPTAAESLAMQHYAAPKKTITNPLLNVQEDATPSMIGKYFKAVEEELQESSQRGNLRARQLAERVATKVNELSNDTLASYKKKAGTDASAADKAGDFERGNKRFKGINKATIKQFDNDIKKHKDQGVAEGSRIKTPSGMYRDQHTGVAYSKPTGQDGHDSYMTPEYLIQKYKERLEQIAAGPYKRPKEVAQLQSRIAKLEKKGVAEAEGTPSGVAHLTKELLTHIVQQSGKEGAHAVVKSLEWGDGAAKELLHLIINDLRDDIQDMNEGLKDPKDNPCWTGYKPVGTKKKSGKTVPNCVPKE